MKNIIKSTAIFMAMMLFAGCEAFLDTESFTDRNTSNFPASETDAMQLVTGIYSTLKVPTSTPLSSYWMAANAASDECYGGGGSDAVCAPGQTVYHRRRLRRPGCVYAGDGAAAVHHL